ncbi:pyridoxal phosphate-dependent transferase [Dichotomopilus funicola]|uniref:Pyridoxal phosphate-dependent transferase n=1 Tax=Dichotomopilus funicola TaxID=1934379 RepID=A0AAN6V2M2_9PEZI|nr:pyridoxal phosphate-dependent transferase [Dichotomopilus funicola]
MAEKAPRLDSTLASLLDRRRQRGQLRSLTTVPPGTVDFSSNDYLSLSSQPAVQQAFLARLQDAAVHPPGNGIITNTTNPVTNSTSPNPLLNPPSLLGSGGSRLLDGNSPRAEALEHFLASHHRAPAALLFNSAMDANVGLFGCVPQPGDAIVYDELIHASVHDGMRASRAGRKVGFAHGVVWERLEVRQGGGRSLEGVLRDLTRGEEGAGFRLGEKNVFVAVEGVYSMDGDVAPLVDVVECVEQVLDRGNGYVIVDEAHSAGIFGECGRGLVCELGLENRVWARVIGFGKAIGCAGGMVLCSSTTRDYLINYARTLIYTTAMSFPSLASIETAYEFLAAGHAQPLLTQLRSLIQETYRLLVALCVRHQPPPRLLRLGIERLHSPVIPVLTSKPRDLARFCQQRGFMVRPIVAPTVPNGEERIRVCLHAKNTVGEVQGLVTAIEEWVLEAMSTKRREETVTSRKTGSTGVDIVTRPSRDSKM